MTNTEEVFVQYVPLRTVKRWPRNPKKHNLTAITASIQRWGFTQPIMLDSTSGRIVAGHGRLEALIRMHTDGLPCPARVHSRGDDWLVPVLAGVGFSTEEEAQAYLIADNRLSEIGGWDDAELGGVLADLDDLDVDLMHGLGFDEAALRESIAVSSDMSEFTKPEVTVPEGMSEKPNNASKKDGCWFYVEYYGDEERFERLKAKIAAADGMKTGHEVDGDLFERLLNGLEPEPNG